eukprot:sb/3463938/
MDIVSPTDSDSEESPVARWICFPDDCSSDEDPWQSMIMASHSQLLVYSLAEWHTTYTVQIEFPHGFEPPPDLRYHLDKQAQILILSSSSLLYLYIFELHKTRGYKSPDVFSFVSCQPIQYKALDFVIMGCEKPDAIQGRYESSPFLYKINLWVATSTGLYRWQIEIAPPSTFPSAPPPVTTQLPADPPHSPISSSTASDVEEISPPVPSLSELPPPNSTLPADFLLTLSQDLPKLVPKSGPPNASLQLLTATPPATPNTVPPNPSAAEPSMVGLLVLLDDVIVDIEKVTEYVCKLLDRGIENSTNIAQNIIIDMYSNKDWFADVVERLSQESVGLMETFNSELRILLKGWLDDNTLHTQPHPMLTDLSRGVTPLLDNIDISHGIYEYVSGDSPLAFSIMPVHHATLSDQISTILGRIVPPLPSPGSLKTGQLVCCRSGDLKWRRGVVRGVFAEDEVSVFLIDVGENEIVGMKNVRHLDVLVSIPPLALKARLARVKSASGEINGQAIHIFK